MASESIVINTGPLILLEKADALDLVARLPFRFFAPLAVRAELEAGEVRGFLSPSLPWVTDRAPSIAVVSVFPSLAGCG